MAALVAGVQYGLSSHSNFHESKSLIFVKLTDSAQRAIEDYLRNRNKISQNPTIQFLGNEGQLSFPSTKSNHGNFTFSLSNNQDIEGPQGGFECVQQIGPKNLESLGALPCKMRIQANDDVYETTRHRMHVAEENNKNKCTRVIKANEPLGRKVKLRGTVRTIPPPGYLNTNTTSKHRESNLLTSTNQTSRLPSSFKSTASNTANNRPQPEKKITDIMRRPLKERLIHLLALRPFKRPELYDRINREGIREKEKNVIATILKQIAFMRDNTYHLLRCVWNDVQEDWPFYTEQEKAMLKRRKPQNLTPPGSSDGGSSGSGQSPNSTHPGSPPAIAAPPSNILGSKRPGYFQGNDGLPTKRQRISHYRKPDTNSVTENRRSSPTNTNNSNGITWEQKHQQRNQQQNQQQRTNFAVGKFNLTSNSDSEEGTVNNLIVLNKLNKSNDLSIKACTNAHNLDYTNHYELGNQEQDRQLDCAVKDRKMTNNSEEENLGTNLVDSNTINTEKFSPIKVSNEKRNGSINKDDKIGNEKDIYSSVNSKSAKASIHSGSNIIGDSLISLSPTPSCNRVSPTSEDFQNTEYPDYLTCYTTISSSEQRTRYKAEFNAYYKEYRKLHVEVVKISKHFSQLEEELREKYDNGNMEGYEATKNQILQEYARTKNINARFYYLHDKLGHIKKLVSEYDAQVHTSSVSHNNNSQIMNNSDFSDEILNPEIKDTRCVFNQLSSEQPITCPSKISHIS